jgi:hypothetical protein
VAERTKATVLKTVSGATRSWVRIPVLPPPIRELRLHRVEPPAEISSASRTG